MFLTQQHELNGVSNTEVCHVVISVCGVGSEGVYHVRLWYCTVAIDSNGCRVLVVSVAFDAGGSLCLALAVFHLPVRPARPPPSRLMNCETECVDCVVIG